VLSSVREPLLSQESEPHRARTRAILGEHPEIRGLIGPNPWSFLVLVGIVAFQFTLAYALRGAPVWAILLTAYCVGAFPGHALFVLIHECSHNLLFRRRAYNLLAGILADLPLTIPGSISFHRYHLNHHSYQGVYELDADLPSRWELRLVGNSPWRKALWLLFFPLVEGLRPTRLQEIRFSSAWLWGSVAVVAGSDLLVLFLLGPKALFYLFASFVFSIGFHPVGGRWIQEHYMVAPPQETYSYYGPLNRVALNVGYHVEHHDFPSVAWNRLPRIRQIARPYYDSLVSHSSLTRLVLRFLFDPELGLHARVERRNRAGLQMIETLAAHRNLAIPLESQRN
jgi:sphingolipid 4-desaturase/C4-monooxygenase